jgi:hypothetical protein
MFTVVGYAQRTTPLSRMLGQVFSASGDGGRVCQAQAMVYNANGRRVDAVEAEGPQPDTGWDTLNWNPPVAAPEWGSPTNDGGPGSTFSGWPRFPIDVFLGGQPAADAAKVHLNWQAKLVPLTGSRCAEAVKSDTVPAGLQSSLENVEAAQFDALIHH